MKKLLTLMLASLVIAGCGGDDTSTTEPPIGQSGSDVGTGSSLETAEGTISIAMKDIEFKPADQTVKVGQKVVWTNEDDVQHDANSTSGAEFETELVGKGGTVEYSPDQAGKIEYVCSVHPSMKGTLTVGE